MAEVICVIMAGGVGERLWPLSRKKRPKQVLSITSDKRTLIQATIDRMSKVANDIYISTGNQVLDSVKKATPDIADDHYIVEPLKKNTAPCIALSAAYLQSRHKDSVMVIVPADAYVKDEAACIATIKNAIEHAQNEITLIGITPTRPATAYGYIKKGAEISSWKKLFSVDAFKEKPDEKTAQQYVDSGSYLWNGGMFIAKTSILLDAIKEHMPALRKGINDIQTTNFNKETMKSVFQNLSKESATSIDYGVIEKVDKLAVVEGDFGWNDVGSWNALEDVMEPNKDGNVVKGEVNSVDSQGNIVVTDKHVTLIGVKDLVIVQDGDAVLVCDKNRAEDVKKALKNVPEELL